MWVRRLNSRKLAAALGVLLLLLSGCAAVLAGKDRTAAAPEATRLVGQQAPESGAVSPRSAEADSPSDRLVAFFRAASDADIRLLEPGGQGAAKKRPLGFLSPDGITLYTVEAGRNQTTLRAYDLESGRELRQIVLDGLYYVPDEIASGRPLVISGNGGRMLLRRAVTDGQVKAWQASGQPRSEFAVLDTDFTTSPVPIDLPGEFWFDALSRDGRWLYLIEIQDKYPMTYSPEKAPNYQVRAYEVDKGRLLPDPVVDKRELEQMNGYRGAAIYSRDGDWLYSLYTRPGEGPFVHALNLASQSALCIDLPFPPSRDFEADLLWSMALSRDGRMLYAVNGMTGQVAQIDRSDGHNIRRSATLTMKTSASGQSRIERVLETIERWLAPSAAHAKILRVPGAVLARNGQILFATGRTGLLAIDTRNLELRGWYLPDLELNSLAMGSSEENLYTVAGTPPDPGRLLMVDVHTGRLLRQIESEGQARAVLRVLQP